MAKKAKKKRPRDLNEGEHLLITPKNIWLFVAGLLSVLVGYIFLIRGSITFAPVLLVLGYVVLIPISFIVKSGEKR